VLTLAYSAAFIGTIPSKVYQKTTDFRYGICVLLS
jgi:hypothetical protein